jgi:2-methylcitrate dehydratase PrpD
MTTSSTVRGSAAGDLPQARTDLTRALAEFVAQTRYSDLPQSVIDHTKGYVLDTLAAGFVGSGLPWATMVLELVREHGGNGSCSVFGTGETVTPAQAALVNGVMISGFESEHAGHVSHPAGTVTPAALAIAEVTHSTGADFILAMALGYEAVCRIGDAQTLSVEVVRGFHNPAANGPFSAAVAVGSLLGFDTIGQANALGIAGSYSSGLTQYAFDGSMTKRLHLGHASQGGLEAALLAAKGFTGPHAVLEGQYGYLNAFSPAPKPDLLLAGLGEQWLLETMHLKAYPCHMVTQGYVAAIQALKQAQPFDPAEVSAVHIRGNLGWELQPRFLNQAPGNHMAAQYSLPFTVAVAVFRNLDNPLEYSESVLEDERIRDLAGKVTWEELPEATAGGASELRLTVAGAPQELSVGPHRGAIANPATFEDITAKFRRYSGHLIDSGRQDAIIATVSELDMLADIGDLTAMIRG